MNGIKKLGLVSMMALAGSLAAQATYGKTYGTANAQGIGEEAAVELSIPAQPVGDALIELALALEVEIAVFSEDAGTLQGRALKGLYNSEEALIELLKGTGLKFKYVNDKTILVGTPERLAKEEKRISTIKPVRIAQNNNDAPNTSNNNNDDDDDTSTDALGDDRDTEEVYVTGSHIRGVGPVGSEVFIYDRDDIEKLGFGTVPEFIQSLPQNFNGGISESTKGLSFENGANNSLNQGTGINLRGLGNVSTLVLLNGQRLAPSGLTGGFVDISMIPLAAIERVEVLTDGASAIYGSDAIGGVVNFILRKDYDGAETRIRYGGATQGGLEEITVGQTFGKTWDKGYALISLEYNHRNPLSVKQRSFSQDANEFIDLLPEQERRNVFLTGGVELSDNVEVFATAYYNLRNSLQTRIVPESFTPKFYKSKNQLYGGTLGSTLDLDSLLGNDWQLELVGSFSHSENFTRLQGLDQTDSDGQIFNRVTENFSMDAKLDGSLFSMPGGDVKLAIGGHFRVDKFGGGDVSDPGILNNAVDDQSRNIYALFGEVYLPFVGANNRMPGVERLEVSLSGRYEHYSDFGSSTNPKVGVLWSPVKGLNFRGNFGTSFRAPLLNELDELGNFAALFPNFPNNASPTGTSNFLFAGGNNADLQPETATLWTVGFDFQPDALPGFSVSATYFSINYKDRISGIPLSFAILNDPAFGPFINFGGPDADFLKLIENYQIINFAGIDLADADVSADFRLQNIGRTNITGLDFSVVYGFDTDNAGNWNFSVNGTYLFDYIVQTTETNPAFQEVGTTGRPVNLRLNAGLYWAYKGFSTNITVIYVDSYLNDQIVPNVPVSSWTTANLTLSYNTGDRFGGWMDGAIFSLSIINLFDQDPPFMEALSQTDSGIFYDPNAASPRGRVISFQITKQW